MSYLVYSQLLKNCVRNQHGLLVNGSGKTLRSTLLQNIRSFRSNATRVTRGTILKESKTLKERLMSPTSGKPFSVGQSVVAGSSLVGLGGLAYYGLSMSKSENIYNNSL